MKDIYEILRSLNISYEKHDHPAVFTVEEAEKFDIRFKAGVTKNLFLRDKKKQHYFLVIMEGKKRLDLEKISGKLGAGRLSFASPVDLNTILQITPGSVSPFCLIHESSRKVQVVVEENLLRNDRVGFHPNENTATLLISSNDFKRFLEWTGNRFQILPL
ncbi:MAG: prolyl-tRNA synthetase associated domain-containing protein [Candidatus Levyibacteriota bacterium]